MPTVFVTPTSRAGSAQLYGRSGYSSDYSPYDSASPETWEGQYQKWRTVSQSGDLRWTSYTGDTVPPCSGTTYFDHSATWTGSATESAGVFDYSTMTSSGTWEGTLESRIANQTLPSLFTDEKTLRSLTRSGNGACTIALSTYYDELGQSQASEFLSNPNNFFDALNGASGLVTGALTTASTTSIDLTTPESDDPIDFEVTAVRLDMDLDGEASTDYVVRLTFSNSDTTNYTVSIGFTTDALGEASLTFDIPQPLPGKTTTFISAVVRLKE